MSQQNNYAPGPGALPLFVTLVTGSLKRHGVLTASLLQLIVEELQQFFSAESIILYHLATGSTELTLVAQLGLNPQQSTDLQAIPLAAMNIPHRSCIPLYLPQDEGGDLTGMMSMGGRHDGRPWTQEEKDAFDEIAAALAPAMRHYTPTQPS